MRIIKKHRFFIFIFVFFCAITVWLFSYQNKPRNFNVLLISIDALRPDHLSCYGYKRNTSPNIDKLANEGVLFTQAIAQSSHTPASMDAILTSNMPNQHLLINWGEFLNPKLPTITKILKSKGYKTIFAGGNDNFQKGLHGFSEYFDVFYQNPDSEIITDQTIEFINKECKDRPFFAWVHYMDVHDYKPSKPFDALFINDEWYDRQKELPIVKPVLDNYGFAGIPETLAKKSGYIKNPDYYIAQYDGAISAVDQEIGRLVKNLKDSHLDKKTIIIITADHGEMLGEHNYYFHHGWFLYEPLINVPLIIKFEKNIPSKNMINTQVSAHLDIAPTILDLLRISIPKPLKGVSLLGIISHKKKYPRPYIFSDEGYNVKCIRGSGWKLIYNNPYNTKLYELYNLKKDNREQNNLVSREKKIFLFLKQGLDEYKQVNNKDNKTKPLLDEQTKEGLRSLGYLQ
jgi:arylsulfatase A-like enzyme